MSESIASPRTAATRHSAVPILVAESVRVVRASPWALLKRFAGEARGFWGRGGGWVAHGGVAWDWTADGPEALTETRRLLARLAASDPAGSLADLRLFGGFSFSRAGPTAAHWAAFPAARFQVPRIELRTDGEAFRLIARARLEDGEDAEASRASLRGELSLLERAFAEDEGSATPIGDVEGRGDLSTPEMHEAWTRGVRLALQAIGEGRFRKVVLARSVSLPRGPRTDPLAATRRLYAPASEARVFLFEPEPGRALLGASPETLARVHDGEAHATAVAGSIRRGETETLDRAEMDVLLSSEKDRREHELVVGDMVQRLADLGADVRADAVPHILTLPGIHHLETRINARLPEDVSLLDLIERLHPTPAVCGHPRDPALAFIEREEGFDRGWYGAPVGWLDVRGNGVTAPALRCALLEGEQIHLFAGAGIVQGSDPEREWEETRLKLHIAARALWESA